MRLPAILVVWYIVANAEGQRIANDQKIVTLGEAAVSLQFVQKFVRERECQCGKSIWSAGEWMTTCRLCADASLESTLNMRLAVDRQIIASWKISDAQSCVIDAFGVDQFTAISCSRTNKSNVVYATFRLRATDQNLKYDEKKWMCGAEAVVSSNEKAFFSNWGDGEICYKDIRDPDSLMESFNATTPSTSVDANGIITRRRLNLVTWFTQDNISHGTTQGQTETFNIDHHGLLMIVVFVFSLLVITACVVAVVPVIRRLISPSGKPVSRKESKQPMFPRDDLTAKKGCATYETLNGPHNDCASYASLDIEHFNEDRRLIDISNEVAAEQGNVRHSQHYQHLLDRHYCVLDDYQIIHSDQAVYAQIA